jgi:hypothetical protein
MQECMQVGFFSQINIKKLMQLNNVIALTVMLSHNIVNGMLNTATQGGIVPT